MILIIWPRIICNIIRYSKITSNSTSSKEYKLPWSVQRNVSLIQKEIKIMELQVIDACDQDLEEEGVKQQVPHRLRVTLDKLHYVLTRRAFYFILPLPSSFFFPPPDFLSLSLLFSVTFAWNCVSPPTKVLATVRKLCHNLIGGIDDLAGIKKLERTCYGKTWADN